MEKFVRKITKRGRYSYYLILPKTVLKDFKWYERQKIELVVDRKKREIRIKDWKPRQKSR